MLDIGTMRLSDKLNRLSEEKHLTNLSELARRARVSKSSLHRWFNGLAYPDIREALRLSRVFDVPLEYLADEETDEITPSELTEDERAIVDLFHALEIDKREALRRLASPGLAPVRSPEFDPASPWVGPQRDTTERFLREKSEERMPKPAPRARPKGIEPRERSNGKGDGGQKGSEGRK